MAELQRCPVLRSDSSCYWKDVWCKMNSMRQTWQLCDVTLCVGEIRFKAHSAILAASSEKLYSMLLENDSGHKSGLSPSKIIQIRDLTEDVLAITLDFIYGMKPKSAEGFRKLCIGAKALEIKGACNFCDKNIVSDSEMITNSFSPRRTGKLNYTDMEIDTANEEVLSLSNENLNLLKSEMCGSDVADDNAFSDVQDLQYCPKSLCLPGGCDAAFCSQNLNDIMYMEDSTRVQIHSDALVDEGIAEMMKFSERDAENATDFLVGGTTQSDGYSSHPDEVIYRNSALREKVSMLYENDVRLAAASISAPKVWKINSTQLSDLASCDDDNEFNACNKDFTADKSFGRSDAVLKSSNHSLLSYKINPTLESKVSASSFSCQTSEAYPWSKSKNLSFSSSNSVTTAASNLSLASKSCTFASSRNTDSFNITSATESNKSKAPSVADDLSNFSFASEEFVTKHCHGLLPPRDPVHDALVPYVSSVGNSDIECPHLKKVFGESVQEDGDDFDIANTVDDDSGDLSADISLDCSDTVSISNPSSCGVSTSEYISYDYEPSSVDTQHESYTSPLSVQSLDSHLLNQRQIATQHNYSEDSMSSMNTPSPKSYFIPNPQSYARSISHPSPHSVKLFPLLSTSGERSAEMPTSTGSVLSLAMTRTGRNTAENSDVRSILLRVGNTVMKAERCPRSEKLPVDRLTSSERNTKQILTKPENQSYHIPSSRCIKSEMSSKSPDENVSQYQALIGEKYSADNQSAISSCSSVRCTECSEVLPNISKLRMHELKVHGKGRLFTCSKCDFRSPRKKDVQAHLLSQHEMQAPGVRVYSCDVCTYKCIDKNRFEEHQAVHSGELVHKCALCGKGYTTRRGMRTHLKYHSATRPHECNICGASFKVRAKLTDHLKLLHEQKGVKPYQCAYCSHRTALRGNCNQHIRKNHPGQPIEVIDHHAEQRRAVKDYDYAGLRGANILEEENSICAFNQLDPEKGLLIKSKKCSEIR